MIMLIANWVGYRLCDTVCALKHRRTTAHARYLLRGVIRTLA